MPNRIVRDAILSSERVASLGWPEEVFYRRLMSIVDDFGRYEANPQLLRSRCYPLQTDSVRAADISRWMAACQKAGLILGYEVAGKQYLEVFNFGQQQRSASKYPPPPAIASNCYQTQANEHLGVSVFGVVSEGVVGGSAEPQSDSPPAVVSVPLVDKTEYGVTQVEVDEWALAYPGVNVVQQLREMRAWSLANAAQRKTRRGFNAFVVRWLSKEQDKAGQQRFIPPAEIAKHTVPAKPGKDPALLKIEQHEASVKPPTPEQRQLIQEAIQRMRA